ncbi:MAG: hypothetical protein LBK44_03790 [Spirochaetales bacterium]|nr:hypothetical protein [Spirochaetales bacterium]
MRFLWAFHYNPLRMAAQNYARELPVAIPWAANCRRQLAAYSHAVAILDKIA